ncbi:hypothetical protein BH11MYX1_BH11MYX1_57240 [soil metagenome]
MCVVALLGCGSAAAPAVGRPVAKGVVDAHPKSNSEALDPMVVLGAGATTYPHSFVVPGLASLELGGQTVQAPPAQPEIAGTIIDEQTTMVRVAVRLDKLAFALWTERPRLLQVVMRDEQVSKYGGGGFHDFSNEAPFAELHTGAHVRVLGHRERWTQIRYLGALEIDGWVPDAVLADRTTADAAGHGRIPTGLPTLMVTPGTVVRAEPKWVGDELAVMANGYFLDTIKEIDDEWALIGYEDGEIRVRGFASRRSPPGRVHKPHEAEGVAATIAANATVARGTCLYAKQHGDPIGFVIADLAAEVASGRSAGWFRLSFDTPWGPLMFAASGTSATDLDACGPPATP